MLYTAVKHGAGMTEYKWRKNSTIAKLYQKSLAGEIKEIRKEVFFEDANLKPAYKEADRVYIKFLMRPEATADSCSEIPWLVVE